MSANFGPNLDWANSPIKTNFIRNFCSDWLSEEEVKSFNAEECKKARLISGLFKSIFSQSQTGMDEETQEKAIEEKFNRLWEWKDEVWGELNKDQKIACDLNLKRLSQDLFNKRLMFDAFQLKQDIRAEKKERQNNFGSSFEFLKSISTESVAQEPLVTALFVNGQIGIDKEGQNVLFFHLNYMGQDPVVALTYRPNQHPPLTAYVPQDGHWRLLNHANEDVSKGESSFRKHEVVLQPGKNTFYYDGKMIFSITIPGRTPAASSSSSSSSSARAPEGRLRNQPYFRDLPEPLRKGFELIRGVQNKDSTCFEVLGLPPNAYASEIEKAYRKLVIHYHPDKHPNEPAYEEAFKILGAAKEYALQFVRGESREKNPRPVENFY